MTLLCTCIGKVICCMASQLSPCLHSLGARPLKIGKEGLANGNYGLFMILSCYVHQNSNLALKYHSVSLIRSS